jgi:polysaccharide chain length determinant protein (PEP-CTERM system associated)
MASNGTQGGLDPAELIDYLRGLLWGCWRFRWPAVALAWGLCVVGWAIVFLQPDVYRASARVYLDTESTLRPLLQGLAVNTNALGTANMMTRVVMSRPNLERLIDDAGLRSPDGEGPTTEALLDHLRRSIELDWESGDVVKVTYQNTDGQKALTVVSALLNSFISGAQGKGVTDAAAAKSFLDEQRSDYARRLNEAEEKLAEFKQKNVGLMPDDGVDYFARLQEADNKLQDISSKLRVAKNRRAELQRQLEGEEPVFGLVPSTDGTPLGDSQESRQIAQFEAQLAELRLKYTDTHPDIVAITKTIEDLRARQAESAASQAGRARAYSPLDLNPVYQQMKMQLSQTDVMIAQLETQRSEQAGVVAGLRRKVDTVPAIEAELKRLTRDYDFTRKQYEELLSRVESARISDAAEESRSETTFRVIDPPTLPPVPVGPPRGLLSTGVLLMALAAGAALAFGLNLVRPVFFTGRDLERRFGVPVLGAVRIVREPAEQAAMRRNSLLLAGSVAGLIAAYAVLLISWLALQANAMSAAVGVAG